MHSMNKVKSTTIYIYIYIELTQLHNWLLTTYLDYYNKVFIHVIPTMNVFNFLLLLM